MTDGGKLIVQLIRVVIGFILAVLAAGCFIVWGLFRTQGVMDDPALFATVLVAGFMSSSAVGGAVFTPAAVIIVASEFFQRRSFIYHVGLAGLIALSVWTLGGGAGEVGWRPGSSVAVAAGFVGGFVYWLVAGRLAGCWKLRKPTQGNK